MTRCVRWAARKVEANLDEWAGWHRGSFWYDLFSRLNGTAEIVERVGRPFGPGAYIRITPLVSWSLGIEVPPSRESRFAVNKIVHDAPAEELNARQTAKELS